MVLSNVFFLPPWSLRTCKADRPPTLTARKAGFSPGVTGPAGGLRNRQTGYIEKDTIFQEGLVVLL